MASSAWLSNHRNGLIFCMISPFNLKPQSNHGCPQMDTDTRQLRPPWGDPAGERQNATPIRVYPCASVVYNFFTSNQLRYVDSSFRQIGGELVERPGPALLHAFVRRIKRLPLLVRRIQCRQVFFGTGKTNPSGIRGPIQRQPAGCSFSRLQPDRKSTRLNSSHGYISYAVF